MKIFTTLLCLLGFGTAAWAAEPIGAVIQHADNWLDYGLVNDGAGKPTPVFIDQLDIWTRSAPRPQRGVWPQAGEATGTGANGSAHYDPYMTELLFSLQSLLPADYGEGEKRVEQNRYSNAARSYARAFGKAADRMPATASSGQPPALPEGGATITGRGLSLPEGAPRLPEQPTASPQPARANAGQTTASPQPDSAGQPIASPQPDSAEQSALLARAGQSALPASVGQTPPPAAGVEPTLSAAEVAAVIESLCARAVAGERAERLQALAGAAPWVELALTHYWRNGFFVSGPTAGMEAQADPWRVSGGQSGSARLALAVLHYALLKDGYSTSVLLRPLP